MLEDLFHPIQRGGRASAKLATSRQDCNEVLAEFFVPFNNILIHFIFNFYHPCCLNISLFS
jgi:hypothetical protein